MKTKPTASEELKRQRHASFSRRHFLRGLGACIALPAFESLMPVNLFAADSLSGGPLATTATGAPLRTAFVYFPNGAIPSAWWPSGEGNEFSLNRTLQPLAQSQQHIQVLGGLDDLNALPGTDGGGDHARANSTFLTGVRLKKSATDIHAGISIDQVIAREVGNLTRLSSLELTCDFARQSSNCDSGYSCAYQYNISWSSPKTPMTAEANPRQVFERLFGAGGPGERVANARRRRQEQRSILDFVLEDAHEMGQRLGARDQDKLDQYLTGVRELENRIAKAERLGDVKDPMVATPAGIPSVTRSTCNSCMIFCCSRSRPIPRASPRCCSRTTAATAPLRKSAFPKAITISRITSTTRKKSRKFPTLTCGMCNNSRNFCKNFRTQRMWTAIPCCTIQ
jgi:hypothetical protein